MRSKIPPKEVTSVLKVMAENLGNLAIYLKNITNNNEENLR
jgi:hypothetical protein